MIDRRPLIEKSSFWEGLARLHKVFSWQGHLRHFAGYRDYLQQLTFVVPASLEEKAILIFSSIPRSFPVTLIMHVVGANKTEKQMPVSELASAETEV